MDLTREKKVENIKKSQIKKRRRRQWQHAFANQPESSLSPKDRQKQANYRRKQEKRDAKFGYQDDDRW